MAGTGSKPAHAHAHANATAQPLHASPAMLAQLARSYLLIAISGALKALPIFTEPIARAAPHTPAFDRVWPLSIALSYPLAAALMIPFGAYMQGASAATATTSTTSTTTSPAAGPDSASAPRAYSQTHAARRLGLASAAGYLALVLAAAGIVARSPALVFVAGIASALPTAAQIVFVMQHIALIVPHRFGVALAAASMVFGAGTAVFTGVADMLLRALPAAPALAALGALLAVLTAAASRHLTFPEDAPAPAPAPDADEEAALGAAETAPLLDGTRDAPASAPPAAAPGGEFVELTLRSAFRNTGVWMYILAVALKRISFPVESYFFKLGGQFGVAEDALVQWFQVGTVFSIVFNLACNVANDYAKTRRGSLQSGARNVLAFVLALQVVTFVLLAWSAAAAAAPGGGSSGSFAVWVAAMSFLRATSLTHFGMSTLLAMDMFGARNIAVVSGSAGGIALGVGETLATGAVALAVGQKGAAEDPSYMVSFYDVGIVCSAASLAFILLLRKQMKA